MGHHDATNPPSFRRWAYSKFSPESGEHDPIASTGHVLSTALLSAVHYLRFRVTFCIPKLTSLVPSGQNGQCWWRYLKTMVKENRPQVQWTWFPCKNFLWWKVATEMKRLNWNMSEVAEIDGLWIGCCYILFVFMSIFTNSSCGTMGFFITS